MASTSKNPYNVSVEIGPTNVVVTMTVSDPFPANIDFDLASLYEPFVISTNGRGSPVKVSLTPSKRRSWSTTWTILIDPNQPLPKVSVAFWSRFGGDLDHEFKVKTWEVLLGFTPTLQLQATVRSENPAMNDTSESRISTSLSDFCPSGGDGWHQKRHSTPIEEEQMRTAKHTGSSTPPQEVNHWFDERHHDEELSSFF